MKEFWKGFFCRVVPLGSFPVNGENSDRFPRVCERDKGVMETVRGMCRGTGKLP